MTGRKIVFVTLFFWTCVSGTIHTLTGSWPAFIEKCFFGGGARRDNRYDIGHLDELGVSYYALKNNTIVTASGDIALKTRATGRVSHEHLVLNRFKEDVNTKKYYAIWDMDASSGLATQETRVQIDVVISKTGGIRLENFVFAGSWFAVSCAYAESYITRITISL